MKLEKTTLHGIPPHGHQRDSRSRWRRLTAVQAFSGRTACYSCDSVLEVLRAATVRCPTISMDASVMDGQPCVKGTRIPVRSVLRSVELYGSIDEAVKCYPHLSAKQVKDALYFSQIILEPSRVLDETAIVD